MIEVRFLEREDGPWITVQANSIDEAVEIIKTVSAAGGWAVKPLGTTP